MSALFALGFLLVAAFFALLFIVPNWAAAGIIAIALALISTIALQVSSSKRKVPAVRAQSFLAQAVQEEKLA